MRWPWQRKREPVDTSPITKIINANVALAARLDDEQRERHLEYTIDLIASKKWEAAAGFALTDEIVTTVAANAAIPILGLGSWPYRQVRAIIVHPTTTTARNVRGSASAGAVSDDEVRVIGLASPYSGPLSVSWDAALGGSRQPKFGRNVIIHEFAHKIDMSDGAADGVPPLRPPVLGQWETVLMSEYERTKVRPSDEALRDYAWTNRAEFFAVATEAFFTQPAHLRAAKSDLYGCMTVFYNQDPARWGAESS